MFYYLRLAWPLIKEKSGQLVNSSINRIFLFSLDTVREHLYNAGLLLMTNEAGVAQLVERNLAKVEVESSRLFSAPSIDDM